MKTAFCEKAKFADAKKNEKIAEKKKMLRQIGAAAKPLRNGENRSGAMQALKPEPRKAGHCKRLKRGAFENRFCFIESSSKILSR